MKHWLFQLFCLNNRNHSSSTGTSNGKQRSSVVPAAPKESLSAFAVDERFDRSLSQIFQRSQLQNKPSRQPPRKFKVSHVPDTPFGDFSIDSIQNFSLSQALLPSPERQIGIIVSFVYYLMYFIFIFYKQYV